ncbi:MULTISPECIES: C40 family peptidase [Janibacter]|uniref:C40 family peptidase n=1 Tax=Janibacter TaxID=53457 RepID=UPI002E2CE7B9|nr:C40 family peptidase [Janibacter melonis]
MTERSHGRHRAAGRYNPVTELTTIVSDATTPLVKGAAVVAASGGLIAAVAVPASAADAPVDQGRQEVAAADVSTVAAVPAVAAPQTTTPSAGQQTFGALTVGAVEKPQGPPPWMVRLVQERRAEIAAEQQAAREQAEREREQAAAAEQERQEDESASRSQERTPAPTQTPTQTPTESAPTQQTETTQAPAASGDVISIAKQYIGVPYVYGGTTPSGFDCSGFTQYVFAKAGKSLPRTTTEQQAATTPVSNPQPGDLVFFGSPAYHMGIYVGDGMMIDAPRTGSSISVRPIFDGVSGYGRVS